MQFETLIIKQKWNFYHSAATLHVVKVSMSMGTEIQTSSDPREGAALLESQATICCPVFMFHLCHETTGEFNTTISGLSTSLNNKAEKSLHDSNII